MTSPSLFSRGSWPEVSRITALLRQETVGGAILLAAAVLAVVWANSPFANLYVDLRETHVGPAALHLDLSLGAWAADGLLAIFFFVAGLEVKREFVAGDLRDPRRAALPVAAAVGGMVAPALVFLAINAGSGMDVLRGWAVPTATDIAFALAVLAVVNTHLPAALRTFLLTLAVVDDLLAIVIIALFYTAEVHPLPLILALVPLAAFGVLVQRRIQAWWLLIPLAVTTWALVHAGGVHATVAGVLLAFTVPVLNRKTAGVRDGGPGPAEQMEHLLRPISAGVAVPIFAFFSAGVTVGGVSGLRDALADPIALGVIAGLVIGKPLGIMLATLLVARFTHASLHSDVRWIDVLGLSLLGGIGFTVSLLIGELAYPPGSTAQDHVTVGVLAGSILAGVLATVLLRARNRHYRNLCAREEIDEDQDGIPDVFETESSAPPGDADRR